MFEFPDQNGTPLNPGDKIEYWSNSYKDWRLCVVSSIEIIRTVKGDEIKMFVRPEISGKNGNYYAASHQKLTKSSNIRKVS